MKSIHVDSLTDRFGGSYIRLKESRRAQDEWKDMGAIVISSDKVKELLKKIDSISANIEKSKSVG